MMEIKDSEVKIIAQSLSYGIMYAKTPEEEAEFMILKVKFEGQLKKIEELNKLQSIHDKKGCPFQYCSQVPQCDNECIFKR